MKQIIYSALAILAATLIAAALPTEAEAEIYDDTLRLHILAASDSEEDQALKIRVRDKLLLEYGDALKSSGGIENAISSVKELLPKIEEDVEAWISEFGYDYTVKAELSQEWYDTRNYEDFSLPAGIYYSLRIIIGEGRGQNWWCVMYPPLCLDLAVERAPGDDGIVDYTREETRLVHSGKYNVKFKLLEIISRAFFKKG